MLFRSVGTRSEVTNYIKKGFVTVNGEIKKAANYKVDANKDEVCFQNQVINYQEFYYYMLHKPSGYVSATEDKYDPTVLDLMDGCIGCKKLFPIGRLDKDTEGLLIMTNDGMLSHELLSPTKHVEKEYYVEVAGQLNEYDIELFKKGFDIGEKRNTLPAILNVINIDSINSVSIAHIIIKEGKFHQIKRMFEYVNKPVTYLKRIRMGNLKLDDSLEKGAYKTITKEEIVHQ